MMNKFISDELYLTFDDVLCVPRLSLESRKTANLVQSISLRNGDFLEARHPIIPANMDSVVSKEVLELQLKSGGWAICHRYMNCADRVQLWLDLRHLGPLFISVGVTDEEISFIQNLYAQGVRNYCIDVAHGHSAAVSKTIALIRRLDDLKYGTSFRSVIIAGNVCTLDGYQFLYNAGADIIKVGIGPSTVCSTRLITGCGFPQLSASLIINEWRSQFVEKTPPIILDGGFKRSGDLVKGLVSGAELTMSGTLFAGVSEGPTFDGKKVYRGMSGSDARTGWFGKNTNVNEGETISVEDTGPFSEKLEDLLGGIRSGMSYLGCDTIPKLRTDAKFAKVSTHTIIENSIRHI